MGNWQLDDGHTEVGFSTRHMMISTVRGRFTDVTANVIIDEEHPERSTVEVTIGAASLSTGNDERDTHLRSADFFDVEQFPELRFRSTRVTLDDNGAFDLEGELTIRDVTRPVTLRGEFAGPAQDPQGGRRAGFSVSGELNREDWGLKWNAALEAGGVLVGKKIKLSIDTELVQAAAEAAATI